MQYYIKAFKNFCNSDGRATRKEFWLFVLFHYLVIFILSFCDGFFGFYSTTIPLDYGYLTLAYLLISICPSICLRVRRLHDVNKSGAWWWLSNVPLVSFYVLYLYIKRGDPVANDYGAPSVQPQHGESSPSSHACESSLNTNPIQCQTSVIEATPNKLPPIKFCRKCGFELLDGSEFCSKCGTPIVKE
ncbi:MAG: DUF805 domain-containing protein [Oscillospiraceae bacterium]|nr:DUF805 domain-containing protein [Oscillospiraceae bacterium]